MPDGLHDVSKAIGRLEASDEASQRQRADLFKKVADLREDMHSGFKEIRDLMAPMASVPQHIKSHCDDLGKLNNYVQRALGALTAVRIIWAVLAGAVGLGAWAFTHLAQTIRAIGGP